jgi:phytanoyl-CoA hydroxylase
MLQDYTNWINGWLNVECSQSLSDRSSEPSHAGLKRDQVEEFRRDGAIVAENAVTPAQLVALCDEFDKWVKDSREHAGNYGTMIDGRPRFDLQLPGHTAEHPVLRRVNSPTEVSGLISRRRPRPHSRHGCGPRRPEREVPSFQDQRQASGSETAVRWHQDFPSRPIPTTTW